MFDCKDGKGGAQRLDTHDLSNVIFSYKMVSGAPVPRKVHLNKLKAPVSESSSVNSSQVDEVKPMEGAAAVSRNSTTKGNAKMYLCVCRLSYEI